ncbi:MAG: WhiB family transcriptional regulator [Gordonia sp. (in: high G+C Gram-positive bacteria)]
MAATLENLPGPNADFWDWQRLGECRGLDSSVFFHPEGERGHARLQRERRAKQVCAGCPVLIQCRTHALEVDEPYGIWGGLSEHDRNEIRRRQPVRRRLAS